MLARVGTPAKVMRVALLAALTLVILPVAKAAAADPVIAAAGDIACSPSSANYNGGNGTADACRMKYTSNLLVNAGLAAVLPLGDTQYDTAKLTSFMSSYDPTWGRVKSISRPGIGNHEYKTTDAAGYFDYFNGTGNFTGPVGDRDKGYYSFDVGTWHLIALNSSDMCTIVACGAGSAQETWLKADLAAHPNYCTLAYWHHPAFSSGHDGNLTAMQAMLQDLYNADADVILGGHAHDYERFAPQNPSGQLDNARGIRQFVVGTGGAFFTALGTTKPNSQVRQASTYGVLKMTLHPTSYEWQFVPEAGKTFTDSGSTACHGTTPPPDTDSPPAARLSVVGTGSLSVTADASASTDTDSTPIASYRFDFGDGSAAVGPQPGPTAGHTYTVAGTYSVTVTVTDTAGLSSTATVSVKVGASDSPPSTSLTVSPSNGKAPLAVRADASGSTDTDSTPIASYRFDFGDGSAAVGPQPGAMASHTYTVRGTYSLTVTVTDTAGLSSTAKQRVKVH